VQHLIATNQYFFQFDFSGSYYLHCIHTEKVSFFQQITKIILNGKGIFVVIIDVGLKPYARIGSPFRAWLGFSPLSPTLSPMGRGSCFLGKEATPPKTAPLQRRGIQKM
jgi:hypothetical protein